MKVTLRQARAFFSYSLLAATLCGCTSIAPFSQTAYEQATSLKAQSLRIMDEATDSFERHSADVDALKLKLDEAFEYTRGRPKNELSTKQWQLMNDPQGHLLGGFLRRWQTDKSLDHGFIDEEKKLVGQGFDEISGLESGKVKSAESAT